MYLRPNSTAETRQAVHDARWLPGHPSDGYHRTKLYKVLENLLAKRGFSATVNSNNGFTKWHIGGDASLAGDEGDGFFELVSPVLYAHQNWRQTVADVYSTINVFFDIKVGKFCGTHVHICPRISHNNNWSMIELRAILKAVCLYNDSLQDMLPPLRKKNDFAVPNFAHPRAPHLFQQGYEMARDSGNFGPIFARIDGLQTPDAFGNLYENRWFAFNFSNLANMAESCGTVEFRSPPASADAKTVIHWAVWLLSFVAASLRTDWASRSRTSGGRDGSVADLRQFLLRGFASLPAPSRGGFDVALLRRINGSNQYTAEELAEIRQIKELKREKVARYAS